MFGYGSTCRWCRGWLGNFVTRTHCPCCGCPVQTPLNYVPRVPVPGGEGVVLRPLVEHYRGVLGLERWCKPPSN